MYFTKVELHNFGIYKGTHEMRLVDKVGQRNITLVGGLNGRGKTTFHDSILIALYGKQAQKYINERSRSYDRLLLDHINKDASDGETYVAVSLILDDGTHLRVKRSWAAKGGRAEQHILVEKDGSIDKYLGENWNYYIEEILPFGIARFFFFNNEKITQLADDISFEQIKASIKSAIGISTVEKAIDHADEVIRRKKKALEAFEKSEINTGYQEVDAQITSIDDKIAEATKKANALEREFEKVAASLEAREKEFWASGGDLSRSRDAIKLEMRKISAEVEQIRSDILRLAVDASTPLFMCRKLVVQSYNAAATLPTSESLRYTSEKISDYHRRIMEGLDTLGLSKADLLSVKTLISSILNAQLPQSAEPRQSQRISATTIMLYKRLISEVFQSITQKIDQLIVQEETQENQRMSLDAHLGTADEKTLAMQLFDALKSLEADKAIAEAERKRQSDMIESLHRQRDVLVAKRVQLMKAIAEKEHANDDNARIVKYAAMSIVALNEFKVRLQREKIAQLSQTATQCFRSLVEKDSLIRAIKDAQAVMYLGRGDFDSYQIARNDLEDSGWLSPEIEINSLDKIPLGEYLQAGISKMSSTDWA